MKLLLDSCTFIWLITAHPTLSATARATITAPGSENFLSVASLWELLIKHRTGAVEVRSTLPVERYFVSQREQHGIAPLPIAEDAVVQLPKLPALHRDPFDRLLICQAIAQGLTLVTPDEQIRKYPVRTLW